MEVIKKLLPIVGSISNFKMGMEAVEIDLQSLIHLKKTKFCRM